MLTDKNNWNHFQMEYVVKSLVECRKKLQKKFNEQRQYDRTGNKCTP